MIRRRRSCFFPQNMKKTKPKRENWRQVKTNWGFGSTTRGNTPIRAKKCNLPNKFNWVSVIAMVQIRLTKAIIKAQNTQVFQELTNSRKNHKSLAGFFNSPKTHQKPQDNPLWYISVWICSEVSSGFSSRFCSRERKQSAGQLKRDNGLFWMKSFGGVR